MQTRLVESILKTPRGQEADRILRTCVHCGFCTATCPTYQLLGDELDGPRGRIYQIKMALEGAPVSRHTQQWRCPVQQVLDIAAAREPSLKPSICCVSAAGPVADNYCKLTNCDWAVDGPAIIDKTGLQTLIINDFLAIGYGIPTLDVDNPAQITKLPGTGGALFGADWPASSEI